ncbi:MAG: LysE family translocator [Ardenticatenaceae bacterium]
MFGYFLRGLILGLPAAATPGPFQAYLLSQTLKNGWRHTLPAALAPLLSDGPIVALVLLILTQMPPALLAILKIAGSLFILYLAWGAFHSVRQERPLRVAAEEAARQSLIEATFMNLLNPNPHIFWSTVGGPILLEGWRQASGHGIAFLLGFYGTLIGGFVAFILLFGVAGRLGARVNRALLGISAFALLLFGLYQLWQGLREIAG